MTQCIFITIQNINQVIMNDRNSKIEISVDLDENKIPEKIKIGDPKPNNVTQITANIKK